MIEQAGNGSHCNQEDERPRREQKAKKPDQKSHRRPILMTRRSLQSWLSAPNAKSSLNAFSGGPNT